MCLHFLPRAASCVGLCSWGCWALGGTARMPGLDIANAGTRVPSLYKSVPDEKRGLNSTVEGCFVGIPASEGTVLWRSTRVVEVT